MSQYADLSKRLYDYSLLNDFEKCERRGYWMAVRNKVSSAPSPAMHFGAAIHAGTDAWRKANKNDQAGYDAYEHAFTGMPEDAKRTFEHGRLLLRGYFKRYVAEPFLVLAGEVTFVVPMADGSKLVGRIDGVVRWGPYIYVLETKTTSSLGSEFMRQFKPNLQIDVYCYAVKRAFGQCDGAVIDAISTAKLKGGTEEGYLRDITDRTEDDLVAFGRYYQDRVAELERRVVLHDTAASRASEPIAAFPQRFAACYYYGACPYLQLCLYRHEGPLESEYRDRQQLEITDELGPIATRYLAAHAGLGTAGVPSGTSADRHGDRTSPQTGA